MTQRPSLDEYFLEIAFVVGKRATCLRNNVGAVIVRDKRIISTGYNGAPRGMAHCLDIGCMREQENIPSGTRHEKCLHGDTIIKLLNGKYETIKHLAEIGEDVWTYAYDNNGKIVPVLAKNPRKTDVRNDLVEIILDTGYKLKCTKDHKILLRNGEYKEAQYLIPEIDSLMPMYYHLAQNGSKKYEFISNTIRTRHEGKSTTCKYEYSGRNEETPTHHLVAALINKDYLDKDYDELIHHKDEDSLNNNPENLVKITRSDHASLHDKQNCSIEHYRKMQKCSMEAQRNNPETMKLKVRIGSQNMTNLWANDDFRKYQLTIQRENGRQTALETNSDPNIIAKRQQGRILSGLSLLLKKYKGVITEENYNSLREKYKTPGRGTISIPTKGYILKYFDSLSTALEVAKTYNHKIISIKAISGTHDVYCMTVPVYHNFAIYAGDDSCVFVHNCRAVHAEQNAIIQAALHGVSTDGATLYCTHQPCILCAKMIINASIKRVVYATPYPDTDSLDFFRDAGVKVEHIPFGDI